MTPDNLSPAEPTSAGTLLALARKKFGALGRAEVELFRAAQEGRPASALTDNDEADDPAKAANWPADRAVRAKCISWLCTDPNASGLITYRGLDLNGMRIDGALELDNAHIKFSLRALRCAFSENISLRDAQLLGFWLLNCRIKSLDASRAIIAGPVYLLGGFKAEGEVRMVGIKIDGYLECDGAQFSNAKGFALDANGARVEGSVFLRNGFKAEGQIRLVRATIGGNLDCCGGQFSNAKGLTLNANGAQIEGNVFLRDAKVEGEVNLLGATIGGNLECDGAQFSKTERFALSADGAQIEGAVFLRNGCKAKGEVRLVGTKIGGYLDCNGAQFSNAKGLALDVYGAQIQGDVFLGNGFKAEGEVKLLRATIGGNLECRGAQLSNSQGLALNADGAKIEGVFLRAFFKAEGQVNLNGATIGNLLIHDVIGADEMILDLRLTKVEAFWDDEKSWPKAGNLFLDGFRYERLYEEAPFQADSRKKWLGLQRRDRFRPRPYEQLATVLRQMGHERDARLVMMEKNRERARFTHFARQGWWWYNLFGRLIGYGYAPWRAFAMSAAMILLGTILFQIGSVHDLISPTGENAYVREPNGQVIEENKRPKISEKYPVFNAFFYSLESFTPLLKLDQSAHWRPNANHGAKVPLFRFWAPRTGDLLRYYLYFHIAAGWLLTSLWVGAVTGLVKT
jgi:sRNA-binding regulator protein Hfq